jgi:hypothetical protein
MFQHTFEESKQNPIHSSLKKKREKRFSEPNVSMMDDVATQLLDN